ncbi:hypothetical protein ABZP36_003636 [Zizania latifolia]
MARGLRRRWRRRSHCLRRRAEEAAGGGAGTGAEAKKCSGEEGSADELIAGAAKGRRLVGACTPCSGSVVCDVTVG